MSMRVREPVVVVGVADDAVLERGVMESSNENALLGGRASIFQ